MRCPECDAIVKSNAKKCPNCSFNLTGEGQKKKRPSKGKESKAKSKIVDRRGEEDEFPKSYQAQRGGDDYAPDVGKPSIKPKIAAVLMVFAAIDAIINAALSLSVINRAVLEDIYRGMGFTEEQVAESVDLAITVSVTCYIVMIIIGVLLLIGAFLTFKKMKWPICLAISIIGLLSSGFVLTASILSLVAMILIILSRKEFGDFKKDEQLPESPLR
jgi:hypothetical protein